MKKIKKNNSFFYGHSMNCQEQKVYDSFQQQQRIKSMKNYIRKVLRKT